MALVGTHRALLGASSLVIVSDTFTRADSALTLGNAETGQAWTAVAGTWGISSNQAYSVTDTDQDKAIVPAVADGIFDLTISGGLTAANYRVPMLMFRYLDANTYLCVRMQNGSVALQKFASGTSNLASVATTTSDATAYALRVVTIGNAIQVYLDGVSKLTHTLAGGDTAYATYTNAGMILRKGGAPTAAARFDGFKVQAAN